MMSSRLFASVSLALLATLWVAGSVLAAPPPPFDVFGIVTVNGADAADGTVVSVRCSDVEYASTTTLTLNGRAFYVGPNGSGPLSVPGNDADSSAKDGCDDGETVTFLVDGIQADVTATWASGASQQIDLAVTTGGTPPLNVYGTVKVNGENVLEGTSIAANCGGWSYVVATPSAMVDGQSVYSLDIPIENPDTPQRDGCFPEEEVTFFIGGQAAAESTYWLSGVTRELNLTATDDGIDPPSVSLPYNTVGYLGGTVVVPVTLSTGGNRIASTAFSVDFDQTCLTFDATDSDENGIPDAVTVLVPNEFTARITSDPSDTYGELDFFIGDELGPLATLSDGVLVEITLLVSNNSSCAYETGIAFSYEPKASFGGTTGLAIDGYQNDGNIKIIWQPGNGNGDNTVDAGDIAACILEIFDGDGDWWLNASNGTYAGTPGCDANRDDYINAGDISCTVLIIFEGPSSCGAGPASRTAQAAAVLVIAGDQVKVDGTRVTIPIRLQSNGAQISTAAFALRFDPARFHLAANDAVTAAATTATVMTQAQGEDTVQVFVGNLNGVRQSFADGVLTTVTLEAQTATDVASVIKGVTFAETTPASLGSTAGAAVSVTTQDGNGQTVQPVMRLYMPLIVGR